MKDFVILTKEDAVRAQDSARYNPAIDSGYFGRIRRGLHHLKVRSRDLDD